MLYDPASPGRAPVPWTCSGADYNRLEGVIQRLQSEGVRRESVVNLGEGPTGVANTGAELATPFRPGQRVSLAFRPSALLLGVTA